MLHDLIVGGIGLFAGVFIGVFIMCLCKISADSGRKVQ